MERYSRARVEAIKAFDSDYFDRLKVESADDIEQASKLAGLEIEHLREKCRDLGITWPRREAVRRLTNREVRDIERRLGKGESPSSIAIRLGVGKSRILYVKKLMERRRA